jgi:hypothetical protein
MAMDPKLVKTQAGLFLQLYDVRRAPIPVLEGLRDYAKEQLKSRRGPLVLCERAYVEHLDELIKGVKHQERLLFHGITGILDDDEDKNEDGKDASA